MRGPWRRASSASDEYGSSRLERGLQGLLASAELGLVSIRIGDDAARVLPRWKRLARLSGLVFFFVFLRFFFIFASYDERSRFGLGGH